MAKFCGKCGSPLNENGLCPNCTPAPAPAPSVETKTAPPVEPAAARPGTPQRSSAAETKRVSSRG